MKKNLHNLTFLLCLILFFSFLDAGIAYVGEKIWPYSVDDYEATWDAHPEPVWDRVFFGNSAVISAYSENSSEAGYVNLGLACGVVTDLWELLNEEHIKVGSELVIGLNIFALYDDLYTNDEYMWKRGPLEPYTYFHRNKLIRIIKDSAKYLMGEEIINRGKKIHNGNMSEAELLKKVESYEDEYFDLPIEAFHDNIDALEKIADWCDSHDIRLRILWMPFHPDVEKPELMLKLMEKVNNWCAGRGIIVGDYTDKLDKECFYDLGHLNKETGAERFTEVIDPWLFG